MNTSLLPLLSLAVKEEVTKHDGAAPKVLGRGKWEFFYYFVELKCFEIDQLKQVQIRRNLGAIIGHHLLNDLTPNLMMLLLALSELRESYSAHYMK